ncbi:hypothetical protein OIB37_03325 [Streptomyces sp. NBC_00820]|uniref:hypothetical protein n=1 Tax=Streptomyces sp. NBC_00820 TaxID=2975842 RepID=UPI002ED5FDE4|nr:hypothetical protein OIB37_03325 [Streptomyces sp. NBC_00820]
MTTPASLTERSVVLALQEITEDLSLPHGLVSENDEEALEIVRMLLAHGGVPAQPARLLDDDDLALGAGRRLLEVLAEDPGTRPVTEPLLADPPVDEQLAVVEVSAGVVVLLALVAFLQTKVSLKVERKSRRGKVVFEVTKEATQPSVLLHLAGLFQRVLGPGVAPPIDPASVDPGQGPADPPGAM